MFWKDFFFWVRQIILTHTCRHQKRRDWKKIMQNMLNDTLRSNIITLVHHKNSFILKKIYSMCQIMYKGILNKRKYLGLVWPADVWRANNIPFCSIFTYFQYSLIHDLALNLISKLSIYYFSSRCLCYAFLLIVSNSKCNSKY